MRRRAAQVQQTRLRITEAAVRLHTTIGPSAASLSAVAEEAGVTRLTLYRHFATSEQLYEACMSHWRGLHPPPDPTAWREIAILDERIRSALTEVYAWYGQNGEDLFPLYRDTVAMPEAAQRARAAGNSMMVDALLDGFARRGGPGRRLRAAAGHVIGFWTWRSLVIDQGLTTEEAVDLAVRFLDSAVRLPGARTAPDAERTGRAARPTRSSTG